MLVIWLLTEIGVPIIRELILFNNLEQNGLKFANKIFDILKNLEKNSFIFSYYEH